MRNTGISTIVFFLMSFQQLLLAGNTCDVQPAWTVFEVNSNIDQVDLNPGDGICQFNYAGYCSLRAAVMESNALAGPNVIVIPASLENSLTLPFSSADDDDALVGDLDILDDLVIMSGSGVDKALIKAPSMSEYRIFDIHKGVALCLERTRIIFKGAGIKDGGAIRVQEGKLLSMDNLFSVNAAEYGGSIYITEKGSAEINSSHFQLSEATQQGGAIYHVGDTLIINDTFFDRASAASSGGAILHQGKILDISSSQLEKNHADEFGGAISVPQAGSSLLISESTFDANCAMNGGGIASAGAIEINHSEFLNQGQMFYASCRSEYGGAIGHYGDGLIINNSIFTNNRADQGGGLLLIDGVAHISDSTFEDNRANYLGGAIHLLVAGVELTGSTFTENEAGQMGGGLFVVEGAGSRQSFISNSTFSENEAYLTGGAIESLASNLLIKESFFLKNSVYDSGGAIHTYYGSGHQFDGHFI